VEGKKEGYTLPSRKGRRLVTGEERWSGMKRDCEETATGRAVSIHSTQGKKVLRKRKGSINTGNRGKRVAPGSGKEPLRKGLHHIYY